MRKMVTVLAWGLILASGGASAQTIPAQLIWDYPTGGTVIFIGSACRTTGFSMR